jgi:hypothetical protein
MGKPCLVSPGKIAGISELGNMVLESTSRALSYHAITG